MSAAEALRRLDTQIQTSTGSHVEWKRRTHAIQAVHGALPEIIALVEAAEQQLEKGWVPYAESIYALRAKLSRDDCGA